MRTESMRLAIKGALVTLVILALVGMLGTVIFLKAAALSAPATLGPVEIAIAGRLRGHERRPGAKPRRNDASSAAEALSDATRSMPL